MNALDRKKQGFGAIPSANGNDAPLKALEQMIGKAKPILPVRLPLNLIWVDESIQVRVKGLDQDTVDAYAAILENGGELDPIIVFSIQREKFEYGVADGFHRLAAHEQAMRTEIPAYIRDGDIETALDFAETANLEHGLKLTNDDKKNILFRRKRRNHEWNGLSNGQLAQLLGVNRMTIGRWLEEYSTITNVIVPTTPKAGADGKVRDTSNIGKSRTGARKSNPTPRPSPQEDEMESDFLNSLEAASGAREPQSTEDVLPPGTTFARLDKGEDADTTFIASELGQARAREALVRLPMRAIDEAVAKLMETRNIHIINEQIPMNDRLVLADEILAIVHRAMDFLLQMMPVFGTNDLLTYADGFKQIDSDLATLSELLKQAATD